MNNIITRAFAGTTADKHAHTKITRNTDTIKNTYVRKLTSIALMAIMVGGGLTFAIPGMEPAYAAQISSNPNLKVSAEGQNADNEIYHTNIVEVVVIDDLNDGPNDSQPIVKVDGTALTMYQNTGGWYGYFASDKIDDTGLIRDDDGAIITVEADIQTAVNQLVTSNPGRAGPDGDLSTGDDVLANVLLLGLDGDFDVVYERPGGDQTVSMELDNPDSSVSLDRANYPKNTGVVITIDDQALNVDPTGEDTWTFAVGGDQHYGADIGLGALQDDVDTRDNAISAARTTMTGVIGTATTIYNTDIDKADLDEKIEAAAAIIDHPLAGELGGPVDLAGLLVLIQVYGQGDRNADDASTANLDDIHDHYKGTALINYEAAAGKGERTSNDVASTDYKGTALIALERVDGHGTKELYPAQKLLNAEDLVPDNYRGSALIDFEKVDGNGDRSVTPDTALEDTDPVPENYRGSAWITYDTESDVAILAFTGEVTDGAETFNIDDTRNLLDCTDCIDAADAIWMTFTEDGDNDSKFTNAPDDAASIKTTSTAQRGLSFSVTYDNTVSSGIGFSSTDIVIDAGDEWNSGQEIGITLTDSDANINSLDTEVLEVSDPDRSIPTITIGDPHTLTSDDGITIDATTGDVTATTSDIDDNGVSQRLAITPSKVGALVGDDTLIITISGVPSGVDGVYRVLNYDLSAFAGADLQIGGTVDPDEAIATTGGADADLAGSIVYGSDDTIPERFTLTFEATDELPGTSAIAIDVFTFGYDDAEEENVNNAIYRLELEEDGDASSDFIGTLEYIGLNQLNIKQQSTYEGVDALGDSIILVSDDDSISVEYRDLDSTGGYSVFTAVADTPTHSGSISLDSDGYKISDTVTVTVTDADLNFDSGKADLFTAYNDKIDAAGSVMHMLNVFIDGNDWVGGCSYEDEDKNIIVVGGLGASDFTLRETGSDSGVFEGTFSVPHLYCATPTVVASVTGTDISAEYVDFRDDSGSTITVSSSAGIRSATGSVSLDRTVYPVPFGADDSSTGEAAFATSNDGILPQGDLAVYVSINDSDFDESSNGIDNIPADYLTISIIRGSTPHMLNITDVTEIDETAPDSGVFEYEAAIKYNDGPFDRNQCPANTEGCILQGDILHVEYSDPSDASGSSNTVTDSATFDLRNGVLQTDQTAYIIGSSMIVTLIEPDLNLDSGSTETYDLDLIEWDSDAGTCTLEGDNCGNNSKDPFGAVPSNLLETGTDTGIFQVVVGIPNEIDEDKLERGEEITLTYTDWGPSGSDFVGDKDEEISTTAYTSNFGATIELDQRVYTWTDKVYITVVAPDHNIDSDQVDEIGNDDDYPIRISTRGNERENYKLVETGADTGIFTGEVILTGFQPHDADGDKDTSDAPALTQGNGPTDGMIETESESGISVSFKYSDGETTSSSALIRWNVGEVQWLEASYPASGSGIVRVIDPDMNLNPEAVDNFDIIVWSDSDGGGIELTVTETNAATGIFEGTVFFGVGVDTSGHRLRVVEGDTVTAQYYDNTLPAPFKETERVRVGATTLIGTIVPPLERVPLSDLRAVDSFGNTLDVISVDSQIQLAADMTNNQDKEQKFAYLIQIQDENGVTVSLDWIAGSLTEGQSLSSASSWTPDEAGTYEVTAFVWESIENPTALSPTSTITITVN